MSFQAIHKETGKYVSIYKLHNDPEWIGREREEFIAPTGEIMNWSEVGNREVPMIYVKESIDGKKPHFRVNDKVALSFSSYGESQEHKDAKERVYYELEENELGLECQGEIFYLKDLKNYVDQIFIEKTDIRTNKRSDLIIEFSKTHPIFRKGVIIEIQLSPQNEYLTEMRTYSKTESGYSIGWIFHKDLFKKENINIVPFEEARRRYKKWLVSEGRKELNDISETINNKIGEMNKTEENISLAIRKEEEKLESLKEKISKTKEEVYNELKESIAKDITNKAKKEVVDELKEKLDLSSMREKIVNEVKEQIHSKANEEIQRARKEYDETIGQVHGKINSINDRMEQAIRGKEEEIKKRVKNDFENDFRKKFKPEVLAEKLQEELYSYYSELRLGMDSYRKKLERLLRDDYEKIEFWRKEIDKAQKKGDKRVTSKKLKDFSQDKDQYSEELNKFIKKNGESKQ